MPIWPTSADELLLNQSGVWRYRELILPVPAQYIVSRPEGNTSITQLAWKIAVPGTPDIDASASTLALSASY